MEFFIAIALLCQVPNGLNGGYEKTTSAVSSAQSDCHKYYIECVENKTFQEVVSVAMKRCIKKRKI